MKLIQKANIVILGLSILIFFFLLYKSCEGTPPPSPPPPPIEKRNNILVLLDLSDRLLNKRQFERDSQIIQYAFNKYKKLVKSNFYIKSNDAFKVVIAPQKHMPVNIPDFEDNLRIDLATLPINKKRKEFRIFEEKLGEAVKELYSTATEGRDKSTDYFGADLWTYFNQNLLSELNKDENNILIILTDGYISFEDNKYIVKQKNRYSNCNFMKALRDRPYWKEKMDSTDYGIIAIDKEFPNLDVLVAEIQPKGDDFYEFDILSAIWNKWLNEMDIKNIELAKVQALTKTEKGIYDFIDSALKSAKD